MPRRGFGASDGAVRPRLRVVNSAPEIVLAAILALFISSAATERSVAFPSTAKIG